MPQIHVDRFELIDPTHGAVPCVALAPTVAVAPLPTVLFLFGGGGSHETLVTLAPALAAAWEAREVPPMRIACAGVPPFCFYLDDPASAAAWETVVAIALPDAVRRHFGPSAGAALVGISMGGYGALKMAFQRPNAFAAVAAIAPMIEPVDGPVPLRNRFHYPPEVPSRLLGLERDEALYRRDHPTHRARTNAAAIRERDLAIRLDAGSRDALRAHDGCESLHRVLWDLDIRHAYELHRDADHVGPTVLPRLLRAFAWVGEHLDGDSPHAPSADEKALAAYLEPARRAAEARDPTMNRTYGLLSAPPSE